MYVWCHEKMRRAVKPKVAVLDVVWNGTGTVVRSAWVVANKSGDNVLRFNRYYFAMHDEPPVAYREGRFRSPPAGAILEGEGLQRVWREIDERYESLPIGARPSIFNPDDWLRMCKVAQERLTTTHRCH